MNAFPHLAVHLLGGEGYGYAVMRWVLMTWIGVAGLSACSTTRYYEREKLSHRCMQFDGDGRLIFIRNKVEAAREGAFGGFGGAAAGSCGCQ
ncbi:MAG: DUF4266 domain-containing protein [Myxococcota bacterium]